MFAVIFGRACSAKRVFREPLHAQVTRCSVAERGSQGMIKPARIAQGAADTVAF